MKILTDLDIEVGNDSLPHLRCADLVISRVGSGAPLSLFSHDLWHVGCFLSKPRSFSLNFELFYPYVGDRGEPSLALVKWIVFCVWQLRKGNPISVTTVRRYLYLMLGVCEYCYQKEIDLAIFFNSYDHQVKFRRKAKGKSVAVLLSKLMVVMHELQGKYHSIALASYDSVIKLRGFNSEQQKSNQHPALPPRLYGELIEKLELEYSQLSLVKDGLRGLVAWFCESKGYARGGSLRDVCRKFGLEVFFRDRGYGFYKNSHISAINDVYYLVKTYLHVFTGMRDDEVNGLRNNCYTQKSINGVLCSLIRGGLLNILTGRQ